MDHRGEWHARYDDDLVKYAAIVENKYGVEVLRGCGKHLIMNVFSLNNGKLLEQAQVESGSCYDTYDITASRLIDYIEEFKKTI
jgi:hypothetical protein